MIRKEHKTLLCTSQATYSDCERYRYTLSRTWGVGGCVNFLMLNPSKATEIDNDPTVERCQRRATAMGFGQLIVTNLFAYRATDPQDMKRALFAIGDGNDDAIVESACIAKMVVCGWGNHGGYANRANTVRNLLFKCRHKLHYLKLTQAGHPQHPLYVSYETKPQLWESANA